MPTRWHFACHSANCMVRHVLTWQPNWQDPTINKGWVGGCSEAVTNWHIPAHRHMNKSSPAQINRISTGPIEEFSVRRTQFPKGTIFQYIHMSKFTFYPMAVNSFSRSGLIKFHTYYYIQYWAIFFRIFIVDEKLLLHFYSWTYFRRIMKTTLFCIFTSRDAWKQQLILISVLLYFICILKTICYKAHHRVYMIYVQYAYMCIYIYIYLYIIYTYMSIDKYIHIWYILKKRRAHRIIRQLIKGSVYKRINERGWKSILVQENR